MPNSEQKIDLNGTFKCPNCGFKDSLHPYGSKQRREQNLDTMICFLKSNHAITSDNAEEIANSFCDRHFRYSYNTKKDIVEQALKIVYHFGQ